MVCPFLIAATKFDQFVYNFVNSKIRMNLKNFINQSIIIILKNKYTNKPKKNMSSKVGFYLKTIVTTDHAILNLCHRWV